MACYRLLGVNEVCPFCPEPLSIPKTGFFQFLNNRLIENPAYPSVLDILAYPSLLDSTKAVHFLLGQEQMYLRHNVCNEETFSGGGLLCFPFLGSEILFLTHELASCLPAAFWLVMN